MRKKAINAVIDLRNQVIDTFQWKQSTVYNLYNLSLGHIKNWTPFFFFPMIKHIKQTPKQFLFLPLVIFFFYTMDQKSQKPKKDVSTIIRITRTGLKLMTPERARSKEKKICYKLAIESVEAFCLLYKQKLHNWRSFKKVPLFFGHFTCFHLRTSKNNFTVNAVFDYLSNQCT